jgi:hypothetical protein
MLPITLTLQDPSSRNWPLTPVHHCGSLVNQSRFEKRVKKLLCKLQYLNIFDLIFAPLFAFRLHKFARWTKNLQISMTVVKGSNRENLHDTGPRVSDGKHFTGHLNNDDTFC